MFYGRHGYYEREKEESEREKNIQILYFDTSKAIKRRVRWSKELVSVFIVVGLGVGVLLAIF